MLWQAASPVDAEQGPQQPAAVGPRRAVVVRDEEVRVEADGAGEVVHPAALRRVVDSGVTLEVCVHTTVREANDRGYECVVLSDCVASYFPEFYRVGLEMIKAQGAIFGWVSNSKNFISAV